MEYNTLIFFYRAIRSFTPEKSVKFFWLIWGLILLSLVLYLHFKFCMEPIKCAGPSGDQVHDMNSINSTQSGYYRAVANLLEDKMNREIDRRGAIGAKSSIVSFNDIGLHFHGTHGAQFPDCPGLASLYTLKPEWFINRGDTRVTHIIAHIRSDPSLQ